MIKFNQTPATGSKAKVKDLPKTYCLIKMSTGHLAILFNNETGRDLWKTVIREGADFPQDVHSNDEVEFLRTVSKPDIALSWADTR